MVSQHGSQSNVFDNLAGLGLHVWEVDGRHFLSFHGSHSILISNQGSQMVDVSREEMDWKKAMAEINETDTHWKTVH